MCDPLGYYEAERKDALYFEHDLNAFFKEAFFQAFDDYFANGGEIPEDYRFFDCKFHFDEDFPSATCEFTFNEVLDWLVDYESLIKAPRYWKEWSHFKAEYLYSLEGSFFWFVEELIEEVIGNRFFEA